MKRSFKLAALPAVVAALAVASPAAATLDPICTPDGLTLDVYGFNNRGTHDVGYRIETLDGRTVKSGVLQVIGGPGQRASFAIPVPAEVGDDTEVLVYEDWDGAPDDLEPVSAAVRCVVPVPQGETPVTDGGTPAERVPVPTPPDTAKPNPPEACPISRLDISVNASQRVQAGRFGVVRIKVSTSRKDNVKVVYSMPKGYSVTKLPRGTRLVGGKVVVNLRGFRGARTIVLPVRVSKGVGGTSRHVARATGRCDVTIDKTPVRIQPDRDPRTPRVAG